MRGVIVLEVQMPGGTRGPRREANREAALERAVADADLDLRWATGKPVQLGAAYVAAGVQAGEILDALERVTS